jgi:hypothetical protein
MHLRGPSFLPFNRRMGLLGFCCSQCVAIKLSQRTHQVPNCVLQVPNVFFNMFPIVLNFTP